jgi:hypothetical protein
LSCLWLTFNGLFISTFDFNYIFTLQSTSMVEEFTGDQFTGKLGEKLNRNDAFHNYRS